MYCLKCDKYLRTQQDMLIKIEGMAVDSGNMSTR